MWRGVLVDPPEDGLAVQVLAAGHEPRLEVSEGRCSRVRTAGALGSTSSLQGPAG